VGGQYHTGAAFPKERHSVAVVQEAVWNPGQVWTVTENLDPRTVRPVANGYTYYIIPAYLWRLPQINDM